MSRLAAIRNAATSGLMGAGLGAIGGGAAAAYGDQSIGAGMLGGAIAGAGISMGLNARNTMSLPGMKASAQRAGSKAKQASKIAGGAGMFGFGARQRAGGLANIAGKRGRQYASAVNNRGSAGSIIGGLAGAGVGFGYATLASNGGGRWQDKKISDMTGGERLQMDYAKQMKRAQIDIAEYESKHLIKNPGAY